MSSLVLWLITAAMFVIGLIGTVVPGLPGIGIVYGGILVYAFATDFASISGTTVIIFGVVTAAALFASYMGTIIASKIGGGKKKALTGAALGALMGTFAGPGGMMIGAFLGAFLGALMEQQSGERALKVAALSVLGAIGGSVIQLLLAVVLIISFFLAILF